MSEAQMMTAERFKTLLEAYGAEIARWPDAERLAAHAYAQSAPEAGARLAEAAQLDAVLAALPAPALPAGLEAAILAEARKLGPARKAGAAAALGGVLHALWPRAALWKPASIFASALVLGALIGVNLFGLLASSEMSIAHDDVLAYAVPGLTQDLN